MARDIFHGGWENHRGAIEARLTAKGKFGEPLTFGSLTPSKGFGRLSVLMFGLLYTYQNCQDMTSEEERDFARRKSFGIKHITLLNSQSWNFKG